jgi:hypothetical protein
MDPCSIVADPWLNHSSGGDAKEGNIASLCGMTRAGSKGWNLSRPSGPLPQRTKKHATQKWRRFKLIREKPAPKRKAFTARA